MRKELEKELEKVIKEIAEAEIEVNGIFNEISKLKEHEQMLVKTWITDTERIRKTAETQQEIDKANYELSLFMERSHKRFDDLNNLIREFNVRKLELHILKRRCMQMGA